MRPGGIGTQLHEPPCAVARLGLHGVPDQPVHGVAEQDLAVRRGVLEPGGDGVTYRPLAEIVTQLGGRERVAALLDADFARMVLAAVGLDDGAAQTEETFWAVRRMLEGVAAERPLVIVVEDIHWAEPTFLDLVEYLGDWIRSVPVLMVCQARPELLEIRPAWLTAKENASLIALRPLNAPESDTLIRGLVGDAELPREARARIAAVGEGNPLFVEEILRMLVDHGVLESHDGRWSVSGDLSGVTIPPTIHALITARLDRLEPEQRAVVERGSVVGRSSSRSTTSTGPSPRSSTSSSTSATGSGPSRC